MSKRICPKCESSNISPNLSTFAIARGSFQNEFKCNDCGYEGMFFPEVEETQEKQSFSGPRTQKTEGFSAQKTSFSSESEGVSREKKKK